MRQAHFDCFSGISGDMTLAALLSAGVPEAAIRAGLASLGLPLSLTVEPTHRAGLAALAVTIGTEDHQPQRSLSDVLEIIGRATLTPRQRQWAEAIFRRLAQAEAKVHGVGLEEVHFHEVGALDSIADVVGAAIGLDLLAVDRFTSRAVPPGQGTVKAAHGIMPVPAPATAELLRGVPLATTPVKGELTTPTGAAILTTVVSEWTDQPEMTIEAIGYGAGSKDFPQQANVLRLLVGEPVQTDAAETDAVWVIETNLDDVPGELIGYALERLFAAGALDVFTQPIGMKKQRPGILLTVLAPTAALAAVEETLFQETGTFGIRRTLAVRSKRSRHAVVVHTPWGPVAGKVGTWRGQHTVFAPEYEDCARLAREHSLPLPVVYEKVRQCYVQGSPDRPVGEG
ncbi:MAG TPA: nickel pincer cofactor biosynthesis protein LarC [Gemmatales bacterium]|nr:nickel pincer cofactor biosynthesis protein LarC [Gemmatales bacterium]HMP58125.1 nickel pincer cofactor biosynthesis protein LarC [Gemmatales bacterium]